MSTTDGEIAERCPTCKSGSYPHYHPWNSSTLCTDEWHLLPGHEIPADVQAIHDHMYGDLSRADALAAIAAADDAWKVNLWGPFGPPELDACGLCTVETDPQGHRQFTRTDVACRVHWSVTLTATEATRVGSRDGAT